MSIETLSPKQQLGMKLREAMNEGNLAERCVYEDSQGRCCAVGFLLTPETRAKILEQELNGVSLQDQTRGVDILIQPDLEKVGITIGQARKLQSAFDALTLRGGPNAMPQNQRYLEIWKQRTAEIFELPE